VLVLLLLVPLVLGVLQLALVLYVRNTLAAAASEGARYAATYGLQAADGAARARRQLHDVSSGSFVRSVTARSTVLDGAPAVAVTVEAEVPALGAFGPSVGVTVTGHAVREQP
jgi:Flp pilus assembly protein TadG